MHPRSHRPHRDDVLIAAAGLAFGLALWCTDTFNVPPLAEERGAFAPAFLGLMCLAVLVRRCAQPWALLLATLAFAGDVWTGSLLATLILFTDVVYAAVCYGSERLGRLVCWVSVGLSVGASVTLLALLRPGEALALGALCFGITVTPAFTGLLVRSHRDAAAAERLRAEQTALLAEFDRAHAVQEERARMARELHDVVANHLSAIAIHATAALSTAQPEPVPEPIGAPAPEEVHGPGPEPPPTVAALGVIRENSVLGLAEMRRLIALLRDAESTAAEPTASPSLDALDALLARCRAADPRAAERVEFLLHDERAEKGTFGHLPAPVELAAYRIVQEAVTNALKHAAPGTATVRLVQRRPQDPLTLHVTSPLPPLRSPADERPRAPGSGAGLVGMRERAALLGGELTAGPRPAAHGEEWQVRAQLPVEREELR